MIERQTQGIYHINPIFRKDDPLLIYGLDAGSDYLYRELTIKDIQVSGFYIVEATGMDDYRSLPTYTVYTLSDASNTQIVLADSAKEIFRDVCKVKFSQIFLYSTAYQEKLVWQEKYMKGTMPLPFYVPVKELQQRENILYGTGDIGHRLFMELLNYEISVKFFCDSNAEVIGLRLMNKPVLAIDELMKIQENYNVIIAARDAAAEIEAKLLQLDITHLYHYNG